MDLMPLISWYENLPLAILIFVRVSALFLTGPIIGDAYTPVRIKVLLALAVTAVLWPVASAKNPVPQMDGWFIILMMKEGMIGVSMGYFVSLFLQGIRFGGELINRYSGFAAAENFDPDTNASVTPVGDLMHILAVLLFFAFDGHHFFFAALMRSYEMIPVGGWVLTSGFHLALAKGLEDMTDIAVILSFPILAAIMAITAVEGVITRAVPQINLLHISFAVKIVVSLLVLYAGLPSAVAFIGTILATMQASGMALLQVLS
jgi:flagellar biosynthesis protein FliR